MRTLFLITVTGFWITMSSLLVQKEYVGLSTIQDPYEVLPLETSHVREGYYAYHLGNQRLGFGQVNLISNLYDYGVEDAPENEVETEKSEYPFTFKHTSFLSFLLLGHENEMFLKGKAELDNQLFIQTFELSVKNKENISNISGEMKGSEMHVTIEDGSGSPVDRVIPIDGPVLHSESIVYVWTPTNLKLGKRGRFRVWNPLTLQAEDLSFRVSHKTSITHLEEEKEVIVIFVKKGEIETKVWVSPEGDLLQMETTTGIIMVKEPGWLVFDNLRKDPNNQPDLPNLYSVASNRVLEDVEKLSYLKAKVTLPDQEQYIEVKKIDLNALPYIGFPLRGVPEDFNVYLEPSEFIQSDDPVIAKQAQHILGDEKNALTAVLKLVSWVNRTVQPVPTSGVPSARQVLATKSGDCNEYTALFTALSRAAGIPTRMVAGLVYQGERFYYHAWPEVFIGAWIPMDPTFGQAPADVTHLPLVEGNVVDQLGIIQVLGNITVSIIETKP